MFTDFIARYSEHIADRSRPFPGLIEAVDKLATEAGGSRSAQQAGDPFGSALKQLGLADPFAAICGADTFGVRKPNPEVLRRTIAAAGARLEGAIMIGDSRRYPYRACGGRAGDPVDFGYTERPVSELGPDRIISRFTQLSAAVAELCRAS